MKATSSHVQFLLDLQLFGMKVGLRNIRALAEFLGNPQRRFPSIHIAGTNGKGSTSSMLAAMLTASGYRTGLYTSPHLLDFTERIRVDGVPIDQKSIDRYVAAMAPEVRRLKATFFEATTAIAFQYFADRAVDVAVIETGLGGRLDATNILTPLLSVITNIGLEHTEHLGSTTSRIAYEKGGIIKPGVPCATGTTDSDAVGMLRRIARRRGSPLLFAGEEVTMNVRRSGIDGIAAEARIGGRSYSGLSLPLAGGHQIPNLQLALLSADLLRRRSGFRRLSPASVRRGLRELRKLSGLRCRLEVLQRSPMVVADVAHNPDGMNRLVTAVREFLAEKIVVVFGVMKDKEYGRMIESLAPVTRLAVSVEPETSRALGSAEISGEFRRRSIASVEAGPVERGMEIALGELRPGEVLLATGSHYVAGEVLNFLNHST